ncbi:hypothetical protein ACFL59_01880 [Planctomycetota bacterium]
MSGEGDNASTVSVALARRWLEPLGIAVAGFVYYTSFVGSGLSLSDEGYLVYGAHRVLQGQLPGADFHAYAPGRYLLLAAWLQVVGTSVLSERLMWIPLRIGVALLAWRLSGRVLAGAWRWVPVVLVLVVPGPWHKTFSVLFLFAAALALVRYLEAPLVTRMAQCGMAVGTVIVFRVDFGISLCAIMLAIVVAHSAASPAPHCGLRVGRAVLAGALVSGAAILPVTLLLLYLAGAGALQATVGFYVDEMARTASTSSAINPYLQSYPWPWRLLEPDSLSIARLSFFCVSSLLLWGQVGLLLFCLVRTVRARWRIQDPCLASVAAFGCLGCLQFVIQPDRSHLLQGAGLSYIALAYWLSRLADRARRRSVGNCLLLLPILVVADVTVHTANPYYTGSLMSRVGATAAVESDRAGIRARPEEVAPVNTVLRCLSENRLPGDALLAVPYAPMFNFLSEMENPTGLDLFFPHTVGDEQALVQRIRDARIRFLVLEAQFQEAEEPGPATMMRKYAPILESWLYRNYATILRAPPYLLMELKPSESESEGGHGATSGGVSADREP